MTEREYFCSSIETSDIIIDQNELALRLKTERGFTSEAVKMCEERLRKSVSCRYSAVRCAIEFPDKGEIDLGFGGIKSSALYKNLNGCKEAFVFAVTLGSGVDRLLMRLSATSAAEHFITDALASAMAEAACDICDTTLKRSLVCRPRYSPGYGDLPLEIQPDILAMVNAQRTLNITVSRSYLMTPTKSITAIMGIENE